LVVLLQIGLTKFPDFSRRFVLKYSREGTIFNHLIANFPLNSSVKEFRKSRVVVLGTCTCTRVQLEYSFTVLVLVLVLETKVLVLVLVLDKFQATCTCTWTQSTWKVLDYWKVLTSRLESKRDVTFLVSFHPLCRLYTLLYSIRQPLDLVNWL